MTQELDEALRWAREFRAADCGSFDLFEMAERYRSGKKDGALQDFVTAYRAGQAAAEARIGDLESVIRSIESQLRNYAQMSVADWAMPTAISGPPGWMMIREILGSIVEYELSCLEEDDE